MQYDQRPGWRLQWDPFNIREWTVIEFLKLGTTVGRNSGHIPVETFSKRLSLPYGHLIAATHC